MLESRVTDLEKERKRENRRTDDYFNVPLVLDSSNGFRVRLELNDRNLATLRIACRATLTDFVNRMNLVFQCYATW